MDGWIGELVSRGVDRPYAQQLVSAHDGGRLAAAVEYFDSQPGAGPGLLVLAVREGRRRPKTQTSLAQRQAAYGKEIVVWLRQHFPQWSTDQGNRTHPAAIACVIRLHHRHGKGRLSPREHGAEIREAVRAFDGEYLGVSS